MKLNIVFTLATFLLCMCINFTFGQTVDLFVCPNVNFDYTHDSDGEKAKITIPKHPITDEFGHSLYIRKPELDYKQIVYEKIVVNVKRFFVTSNSTTDPVVNNVITIVGRDQETVDTHIFGNSHRFAYQKHEITKHMGYSSDGHKFVRTVALVDDKLFFALYYQTEGNKFLDVPKLIKQHKEGTLTFNEFTFTIDKLGYTNYQEVSIRVDGSNTDSGTFELDVPKEVKVKYCNGMPHNRHLKVHKNLYQPTALEFTRKVIHPGFHKIYQNTLKLEKFMNPNCRLKIVEYVSNSIFFDRDELRRLHDLNMNFEYSIDIEKPSNVSQHHLVTYTMPIWEKSGMVSNINTTQSGEWLLKWYFPFHLRYQLPNKKSESIEEMSQDTSEFYVRDPTIYFTCDSTYVMHDKIITNFDELVVNDMNDYQKEWSELHIMPGLTEDIGSFNDYHHQITVPVLPNIQYMDVLGLFKVEYEVLSVSFVLSSIFLIGLMSYTKSL